MPFAPAFLEPFVEVSSSGGNRNAAMHSWRYSYSLFLPGCGRAGRGEMGRGSSAGSGCRGRIPAPRLRPDFLHGVLRVGDFDLPRLGLSSHRDAEGQDAVRVARLDVVGVQGVAEDQLAAEDPRGRSEAISSTLGWVGSRRSARTVEDIALDVEIHRVDVDSGKVERDDKSPSSCHASIGMAAGRAVVRKTCWVSRSNSRNGQSTHQHHFPLLRTRVLHSGPSYCSVCPPALIICCSGYRFFIAPVRNCRGFRERESRSARRGAGAGLYAISVVAQLRGDRATEYPAL